MIENQVGDKIRLVRKQNGLSQEEFAFRIGVSKQTISSWELGTAQPGFEKIKLICIQFKIDANEFVYAQNDNHIVKPAPEVEVVADKAVVESIDKGIPETNKRKLFNKKDVMWISFIICVAIFISLIIFFVSVIFITNNGDDYTMSVSIKGAETVIAILLIILGIMGLMFFVVMNVCYFYFKTNKTKKEKKNDKIEETSRN